MRSLHQRAAPVQPTHQRHVQRLPWLTRTSSTWVLRALPSSQSTVVEGSNTNGNGLRRLEAQVERLSDLVLQQQRMISEQATTIQELSSKVQSTTATPSPATPAPPQWAPNPLAAQTVGYGDKRLLGLFDARFHSTAVGATPKDFRVLPDRIFLVRHAESEGNVDNTKYAQVPDSQVPLTEKGAEQARSAGSRIRSIIEQHASSTAAKDDYKLFFYISPYKRSQQTYKHISSAFCPDRIVGVQEEVQLREQDFGNFQDPEGKQREKTERLRFGRFYYRFPDGESGADVYDRLTLFEDHLIRDINAGRYGESTNLVLVTHGLALRIFLMRWFHWSVDEFLQVYNPPNAEPLVLERVPSDAEARPNGSVSWVHTKALYRLTSESMHTLRGCTPDMCTTNHRPRPRSRLTPHIAREGCDGGEELVHQAGAMLPATQWP